MSTHDTRIELAIRYRRTGPAGPFDVAALVGRAAEAMIEQAITYGVVPEWHDAQIRLNGGTARVIAWCHPLPLLAMHRPGADVDSLDVTDHECGPRCGDRLDEYGVTFYVHTYDACATCVGDEGIEDVPWPCPTLRSAGITEDVRALLADPADLPRLLGAVNA